MLFKCVRNPVLDCPAVGEATAGPLQYAAASWRPCYFLFILVRAVVCLQIAHHLPKKNARTTINAVLRMANVAAKVIPCARDYISSQHHANKYPTLWIVTFFVVVACSPGLQLYGPEQMCLLVSCDPLPCFCPPMLFKFVQNLKKRTATILALGTRKSRSARLVSDGVDHA